MFTDLYGIAVIVITVVASIQFVSHYAYKRGKDAGISEGRCQILIENMVRTGREIHEAREMNLKVMAQ